MEPIVTKDIDTSGTKLDPTWIVNCTVAGPSSSTTVTGNIRLYGVTSIKSLLSESTGFGTYHYTPTS